VIQDLIVGYMHLHAEHTVYCCVFFWDLTSCECQYNTIVIEMMNISSLKIV